MNDIAQLHLKNWLNYFFLIIMLIVQGCSPDKNNRISWSGKVCGKYHNQMRASGQLLYVDENKDISIFYDYEYDQREYKSDVVPTKFRDRDLLIAKWIGYKKNNHYKKTSLEEKVNKKFNQNGFFKCLMENGVYSKIVFGEPINFDNWISVGLKCPDVRIYK